MKKTSIVIAVIVIILIIILVSGGSSKTTTTESIKIGAALSLTGDAATWGEAEKNGINLALNEINNSGGIDGRKVEIITEDTRSSSKDSISAVQKLLNLDNVKYIIGPTWLDSYPGAQSLVKGKDVVMISPSASITAVQQEEAINNVFTVWYRVNSITEGLAKAIKQKGNTKIALVFQNDAYYTEFINFFKKAAKEEGIEIVSEDLINPGKPDFKTIFSKIKSKGANGIVFGMYDEKMVFGFLKDHKQIVPNLALYSNEVIRQYIENNNDYKPYIEGTVFVENAQISKDLVDKYKKTYSTDPVLSASTAYDTMKIIADVLKNGASNPVEYLKTKTFSTASLGSMKFDSIGGVVTESKQYQIREVKDGKII